MKKDSPKILVIDIETKPMKSYHWRMFKENIGVEQVIEPGGLLCFAAKWVGNRDMFFFSDWENGHQEMVEAAHRLFCEADAIVTFNGDRFDIPKLTGEFLLAGLAPPPPHTSIDLIKTIKYKFGFDSNRLAFVAPHLNVGKKMKHEGFELWAKVLDGDTKAQNKMMRYCMQDTRVTDKLYLKIRPYIRNHPHMGKATGYDCGACGSSKLQSRGERRTKAFIIQRLHCTNCGSWMDGKRTAVKKVKKT